MTKRRKNTEAPGGAEKRSEEAYFGRLAMQSRDVLYRLNLYPEPHFDFLSPSITELTGYTPEEFYVDPSLGSQIFSSETKSKISDFLKCGSAARPPLLLRLNKKDGTSAWAEFYRFQDLDEDGRVIGVSGIIRDVTNVKNAETAIDMLERRQAVVAELGRLAFRRQETGNYLSELAAKVTETLEVEFCEIFELGPDRKTLRLVAGYGYEEKLLGRLEIPVDDNSQAGFTLLAKQAVVLKDCCSEKRFSFPPLVAAKGIKSGISVVIGTENTPWGVLSAHSKEKRRFSYEDCFFLQSLANVLADSMGRLKYENELIRHLKEKEDLLHEVHHRVNNNLQLMLSLFHLQRETIENAEMLKNFRALGSRIQAIASVNEALYHSGDFSRMRIDGYILTLYHKLSDLFAKEPAGIDVSFDLEKIELGLDTATPFGLIVNEILTNALKFAFPEGFAKRPRISVGLARPTDDVIRLSIEDNGIGLAAPYGLGKSASLGLNILPLLAQQIKGKLSMTTSSEGTRYELTFPAASFEPI